MMGSGQRVAFSKSAQLTVTTTNPVVASELELLSRLDVFDGVTLYPDGVEVAHRTLPGRDDPRS
jgi:hypothetical protein